MALKKARRELEEAALTITSMMDMMTIILVFLLKSYSTTDITVKPDANLMLPASSSVATPSMAVQVLIAKNRILVDGDEVMLLDYDQTTGTIQIPDSALDPSELSYVLPLGTILDTVRDELEGQHQNTQTEFGGEILLQIDRDVPFDVVQRVLYTAGMEQFGEFQFVVIKTSE